MTADAWVSVPSSDLSAPWRLAAAAAPFLPRGGDPDPRNPHSWGNEHLRLIALEMVGPRSATDAVRRALRRGDWVSLGGASTPRLPRRAQWAPGGLVEFARRLPSGQMHALLLHPQATLSRVDPEGRAFLIDRGDRHDPEHTYAVLGAALPLPILPEWTAWLADRGASAGLLARLPSHRCAASEVVLDIDAWAALIQSGIRSGILRLPAAERPAGAPAADPTGRRRST
jgi:hypothetical protein